MVVRLLPLMLLMGPLLASCGASEADRIRELEERIEQLEDENAQLRKGIVPADPGAPAVPVDPGDAPAWGATPGDPGEEIPEVPPPSGIVPVDTPAPTPAAAPDPTPAAAPDPTPTAPPPPAAQGGDPRLTIYRAAMARDVEDRAPVGEATTFPVGAGKVYCFTEVGPAAGVGETQLIHHWYYDGESQGETRLRIAGDHWRTFSNRTLTEARKGAWRVDLVDDRGNVLRTLEFRVE